MSTRWFRRWRVALPMVALNAALWSATAAAACRPQCYAAHELPALRQWEQSWVGSTISTRTIDSVAHLLPAGMVTVYRNASQWGAPPDGFFFEIAAYEPVPVSAGMRAATRRWQGQVHMLPDGSLQHYARLAGRPFPDPQTGLEVAWNYDFNTHGDASAYTRLGINVMPGSRSDKSGTQDAWELFWIHRVDLDPRPQLAPNPKNISRSTFYHQYAPPEFRNIRMFNLRYIDQARSDTAYMWLSSYRRIQRLSNDERTDAIDGTNLIYDDEYGWDGQILRNRYRLTGKRELLCARHQNMGAVERIAGQAVMNRVTRERCRTLVVEVVSRDPAYLYGKRVWYVDPESCLILWTEIYDRQLKLWKCYENLTDVMVAATGEPVHFIVGAHYLDLQRMHGGLWQNQSIAVSSPVPPTMFTLHNLQKGGY